MPRFTPHAAGDFPPVYVNDPAEPGSTTAGIQEALDLMRSENGNARAGTLVIRGGNSTTAVVITDPIMVEGWQGLHITSESGYPAPAYGNSHVIQQDTPGADVFIVENCDGLSFSNIGVRGGSSQNKATYAGIGFHLRAGAGKIVRNVSFRDCAARWCQTAWRTGTNDTPDDQVDDVNLHGCNAADVEVGYEIDSKQLVGNTVVGCKFRAHDHAVVGKSGFLTAVGTEFMTTSTEPGPAPFLLRMEHDMRDVRMFGCRAEIKEGGFYFGVGRNTHMKVFHGCHWFLQDHSAPLVDGDAHDAIHFQTCELLQRNGRYVPGSRRRTTGGSSFFSQGSRFTVTGEG